MNIYIEDAFLQHFNTLPEDRSFGVEALWKFVNSYAQITWYFDTTVSADNFSNWEFSNKFLSAITGKSHIKKANCNFKALLKNKTDDTSIVFAHKAESWHNDLEKRILIFTAENFETEIKRIADKLSFYSTADEIKDWHALKVFAEIPSENFSLIDKYIFTNYLDYEQDSVLEHGFIQILRQIGISAHHYLDVYTSVPRSSKTVSNFSNQLEDIYLLTKEKIRSDFYISVINTDVDKSFDFHDRNLLTDYAIVKIGSGFKSSFRKFTNTELEGYSVFEKKGYDMIRYRKKMLSEYWKNNNDDDLIIYEN